jgi:LSD1 subclass zinc finger protein
MPKQHKRIQSCKICERATNHAYICRRCANELHDLLVGSKKIDGQPGIAWYAKRLRESAYRQTRLARSLASRASTTDYALLGNRQAAELLARIGTVLARWEAICDRLRATHGDEMAWVHAGHPTKDFERLEVKRARYIAAHVVLIRHHCPDAHRLHAEMLDCARNAWRIINRPNDVCCGACPTRIEDEKVCGTLLYAEEGASGVQCPLCHTNHHVETLRESLRNAVQDMLFSRDELVRLMETRLNDRIPQSTFSKLLRDGRLAPRHIDDDGVAWFTYNDVCEARAKPGRKPGPKAKVS